MIVMGRVDEKSWRISSEYGKTWAEDVLPCGMTRMATGAAEESLRLNSSGSYRFCTKLTGLKGNAFSKF